MSENIAGLYKVKQQLIKKLNNKEAVIGILGLGYVGLPLVLRYSSVTYKVIGFDIDEEKVRALSQAESYIEHISKNTLKIALKQGFLATTDFSRVSECDALIVCVPTPLNKYREPDLSFVIHTMEMIKPFLHKGQVISLESTTYPGTTEEELLPRITSLGLHVGEEIFLVYSPEREDPANSQFTTQTIPKVCGGHSLACLEVGVALYSSIIDTVVPVSSTKVAEMTKLLENIHRAVNIGLVNEMKIVADKMDIDIYEVIRAAATKPFGFTPYYPGPGLGGHCIPIDPFYLTWKAREYDVSTRFIELAGEVNTQMPKWVISKVMNALNEKGKALKNSKILILGVAYKKNVDDTRESPAFKLIELLLAKGALVDYSDPHVPILKKHVHGQTHFQSIDLTAQTLARYDCLLLVTHHDKFDYLFIQKYADIIIDTRGVYQQDLSNVIRA